MPRLRSQTGVRKSSSTRKGRVKAVSGTSSSLRPKTQVAVAKGFKSVLSANDKAVKITYTR
nr:hypothetical protein [Paenibacillus bovis]